MYTLRVKKFVEISLSRTVSEINAFLHFSQKFKMAAKSGGKMLFCKSSPVGSVDTLWVKNFVEIPLSRSVYKINMLLHFTQKFKMATRNGGKRFLGKVANRHCKNFIKIAVSCRVSEMKAFLRFTQKFKMAAKRGRKTIFGKIRQ